jgi:16S rRNA processing protein RimM
MTTSTEDRVCVGAVTGVRGLKGEVRIKSFTADPDDIAAYGPVSTEDASRSFRVKVTAHAKGLLIARLDGVNDRTVAEGLKGTRLYVPRSALPKPGDGDFYHADLVGLAAETETGERLGTVKAVHNFGAGDILEIAAPEDGPEEGKEDLMVPFTLDTVPEVDLPGRRVVVVPPAYVEADGPDGEGEDENGQE